MNKSLFAIAASAMLLAGCTVGPDYAPPAIAVPPVFSGSQPGGTQIEMADWWTAFDDPQLTELIVAALRENPDIAIAASRVQQARLLELAARTRGLPSIGANTNVSHVEFSENAGLSSIARAFGNGNGSTTGAPSGFALPGSRATTFALGFDASWELDVFGGVRRGREAARARTEAAEWNGRDAAMMLSAEIAQAYFALRFDQQQIALIEHEMDAQQRIVEIAEHNADVGLIARIDAINMRQALNANRARSEPVRADIAVRRHAVALLLGKEPETKTLASLHIAAEPHAAPVVPVGLPSDLLRRRPDIRAAERDLAASSADIGVAVADLYPKFSLTGLTQLISTALGNLFTGDSVQLTGAGAATFPVFDFGTRKANVDFYKQERYQAYLRYRQAVLGALRDVEDPLVQIDGERKRNSALRQAVDDAAANSRAASARFRTGFVAEDAYLQAVSEELHARENLAASEAQLRQYTIALFKAMGGGWNEA